MRKNSLPFINIGVSSIITVFLTLFLVTFAALSVLTANSDYQLSEEIVENTTAYYAADLQAKKAVASIEEILYQLYLNSFDEKSFFSELTPELFSNQLSKNVSNFKLTEIDENMIISYETPVSETQVLYVSLIICYPELESDTLLKITSWQTKRLNESENNFSTYDTDTNESK